jgi:hypothetical protein
MGLEINGINFTQAATNTSSVAKPDNTNINIGIGGTSPIAKGDSFVKSNSALTSLNQMFEVTGGNHKLQEYLIADILRMSE